MKKFLIRLFLFCIPIFVWFIVEALLPITTFTHRTYEAVKFKTSWLTNLSMYPDVNSTKKAEGDICHHTTNAVIKNETWIHDKLGFRNAEFVQQPDVLFIGDSFFHGCALSQDELISNRVKDEFGDSISVYNLAPTEVSEFDKYLRFGILKKPKLLIYSIVERHVPQPLYRHADSTLKWHEQVADLLSIGNFNVHVDKAIRQYGLKSLRARLHGIKGGGRPGIFGSGMFFYHGAKQAYKEENLQPTAERIIQIRGYCDSLGIKFLFVPMANKETVYYDLVPFDKQPNYLFKLDSMLCKAAVNTIKTVDLYNNFRKTNSKLLYHTDDTHWNGTATSLIGKEISRVIREKRLLD